MGGRKLRRWDASTYSRDLVSVGDTEKFDSQVQSNERHELQVVEAEESIWGGKDFQNWKHRWFVEAQIFRRGGTGNSYILSIITCNFSLVIEAVLPSLIIDKIKQSR